MRRAGAGTQEGRTGRPLGGNSAKRQAEIGSTLGQWLRFGRVKARMSQEQLAQEAGCSQSMISDFEAGRRLPEPGLEAALWRAIRLHTQTTAPVRSAS